MQREKTVALAREKLVQDSLKKTEQRRGRCPAVDGLFAAHIADIARSICNLNVFMRMRACYRACYVQYTREKALKEIVPLMEKDEKNLKDILSNLSPFPCQVSKDV